MIQRIRQQHLRRVVRGCQQHDAPLKKVFQQRLHQHGVAGVVKMKFVETQQAAAGGHLHHHRLQARRAGGIQPLVQFAEEVMKMDPTPGGKRQAGKKVIENIAFPSPGASPDVQSLRRAGRGQQLLAQGVQASDERQLIVVQRQTGTRRLLGHHAGKAKISRRHSLARFRRHTSII